MGMTPKITKEQRDALEQEPGKPLRLADDESERVYVVVDEQSLPTLWEDYIRREVQRGLDQLDRGEGQAWDAEGFLKAAHRRAADRQP